MFLGLLIIFLKVKLNLLSVGLIFKVFEFVFLDDWVIISSLIEKV